MTISEHELHAFIDGELDEARRAEITRLLAADPALAARVEDFRADRNRLQQIYGAPETRPLPAEWLEQIESRVEAPVSRFIPRFSRGTVGLVGALAASVLILLGTWLTFGGSTDEDAIVAEALAARGDTMQAQQVVDVQASGVPEARNQVLANALDMKLKAPDLARIGYQLAAIRIYSGVPGGKAVELRYRGEENRVFTLYLRHPSSPARVDLFQRDGLRICIWQDDVIGTVMLGQMSAGEMARVASAAYAGLNL
jgi:anti-sigma factor RsiW